MMVTEFAPCGSLMDCIMKQAEPSEEIKAKVLLDVAKGLAFPHMNGILHRDIKPNKVCVTSLDEVIGFNGKLTDFGSSRNINVLLTNMAFTKGVGSPTYMAPEILNKESFKKGADISFGVWLYKCFLWCEENPKAQFKFPWHVVTPVEAGKRHDRPSDMAPEHFGLGDGCWQVPRPGSVSHLGFK